MIELRYCTVMRTPTGCVTRFHDGSEIAAHPHDTPHYHVIAHRLGYGDDLMRYCVEHEVCHSLVAEWFEGGWSFVLWALAHDSPFLISEAVAEEVMAQTLQRWVRANERPIIGGVDWDGLKVWALDVLDALNDASAGSGVSCIRPAISS